MSFRTAEDAYIVAHTKNQNKRRKKIAKLIDEYVSMGAYFMNYNYGDELEIEDVLFLRGLNYKVGKVSFPEGHAFHSLKFWTVSWDPNETRVIESS